MTVDANRVSLLPCPFCGGEGLLHNAPGTTRLWAVSCKNCDSGPHGKWSPALAITAWNTRSPSLSGGEVERFEPFADQDDGEFTGMGAVPDGDWVRYADYAAALASPAPLEGVTVKPLEWVESNEGYAKGQWFAKSIFGEYCTYIHSPSGRAWLQGPNQLREFFDTIASAKAAAQADYDRRILSAIVGSAK